MMTISYRGIPFSWVRTDEQKYTPVMSDDGQDYLYTKVDLVAWVTMNPQVVSYVAGGNPGSPMQQGGQLAARTEAVIRHTLAQPRGQLTVSTIDGATTLKSPADGYSCDAAGGPYCEVLGSPIIHGDRTWEWKLHFTTYIRECKDTRIFLAHRFQQSVDVDEDGFANLVTHGKVTVNLGEVTLRGGPGAGAGAFTADTFRKQLFFPLAQGFQRKVRVAQSSDGCDLEYTVLDQQRSHGYPGDIAQRIEAYQTASFEHRGIIDTLGPESLSQFEGFVDIIPDIVTSPLRSLRRLIGIGSDTAKASIRAGLAALPQYHNHVVFRCWGSPTSNRSALTALALGLARSRIGDTSVWTTTTLRVTEELTGKFSQVEMTHSASVSNLVAANLAPAGLPAAVIANFTGVTNDMLRRTSDVLSNFPGEVITTSVGGSAETISPGAALPGPPGDGISRGTWLQSLVYQALTSPCSGPAAIAGNTALP